MFTKICVVIFIFAVGSLFFLRETPADATHGPGYELCGTFSLINGVNVILVCLLLNCVFGGATFWYHGNSSAGGCLIGTFVLIGIIAIVNGEVAGGIAWLIVSGIVVLAKSVRCDNFTM